MAGELALDLSTVVRCPPARLSTFWYFIVSYAEFEGRAPFRKDEQKDLTPITHSEHGYRGFQQPNSGPDHSANFLLVLNCPSLLRHSRIYDPPHLLQQNLTLTSQLPLAILPSSSRFRHSFPKSFPLLQFLISFSFIRLNSFSLRFGLLFTTLCFVGLASKGYWLGTTMRLRRRLRMARSWNRGKFRGIKHSLTSRMEFEASGFGIG